VSVRIYYLKQKTTFLDSSFDKLWRKPNETLGSDKVGDVQAVTVTPGGRVPLKMMRPVDAAYIGVIADFCRDGGSWHKVIELDKKGQQKTIDLYQIRMSIGD
jgi:type VI secretion system VasD/TssJ family lipoprotein